MARNTKLIRAAVMAKVLNVAPHATGHDTRCSR